MRTQYEQDDISRAIDAMVDRIAAAFSAERPLSVIGMRTRGEMLAERIAGKLRGRGFTHIARGVLDITLYRDDLSEAGGQRLVQPTEIDVDIDGQPLVLVDDVIFTGRSIRAALGALLDLGRPSLVRVAVLADRGGRELPIQPDFVGLTLRDVPPDHRVNVRLIETDGKDEIVVEPRA